MRGEIERMIDNFINPKSLPKQYKSCLNMYEDGLISSPESATFGLLAGIVWAFFILESDKYGNEEALKEFQSILRRRGQEIKSRIREVANL